MSASRHEDSALDVALKLARCLRDAGIPYALGGALALGAHGILRATRDVDMKLFVEPSDLAGVFTELGSMGIPVLFGKPLHQRHQVARSG